MVDESLIGTGWRKRAVIIPLEYAWSSKINSSLDWMGASGLQRLGVWAEVKGHGSNCPWQAGLSSSSLMYPSPWNPSRFKRQKDSFTCFILPVPFPWDLNNTFRESSIFKGTRPSRKKRALLVTIILSKGPTLHYIQNFFSSSWTTWVSLLLTSFCCLLSVL